MDITKALIAAITESYLCNVDGQHTVVNCTGEDFETERFEDLTQALDSLHNRQARRVLDLLGRSDCEPGTWGGTLDRVLEGLDGPM